MKAIRRLIEEKHKPMELESGRGRLGVERVWARAQKLAQLNSVGVSITPCPYWFGQGSFIIEKNMQLIINK